MWPRGAKGVFLFFCLQRLLHGGIDGNLLFLGAQNVDELMEFEFLRLVVDIVL